MGTDMAGTVREGYTVRVRRLAIRDWRFAIDAGERAGDLVAVDRDRRW